MELTLIEIYNIHITKISGYEITYLYHPDRYIAYFV